MSHHTRSVHCLLLREYKEIYGDHKETAVQTTYHKCGICKEVLFLDVLEISVHLKRAKHGISHKEYNAKYMTYKVNQKSFRLREKCEVKHVEENKLFKSTYKREDLKNLTAQQLLDEITLVLGA